MNRTIVEYSLCSRLIDAGLHFLIHSPLDAIALIKTVQMEYI
jgi:hypothetical protein